MSGTMSLALTLVEFPRDERPYLVFRIGVGDRRVPSFSGNPEWLSHTEGSPLVFVLGGFVNDRELIYMRHEGDVTSALDPGSSPEGVNVIELVTCDPAGLVNVVANSVKGMFPDLDYFPFTIQRELIIELYDRASMLIPA